MKVRDHPSIIMWPPEWISKFGYEAPPLKENEDLILREVELLAPRAKDYHGYIRITGEYGRQTGKSYTGLRSGKIYTKVKHGQLYTSTIVIIRDPELVERLHEKLKNSIGQTLQEIGDSEI